MEKRYRAIVAIDFDKTISDTDFPTILGLHENAREVVNRLIDIHDCYVILWTSRNNDYLADALAWMKAVGVRCHAVNQQYPPMLEVFNGDSRKVGYDVLIDDKNLDSLLDESFPDWLKIEQQVIRVIYHPNFWSLLNHCH